MTKQVKYKNTDLEWCPKIPEHWELKKLKYLVEGRLEYGANEPAEQNNREEPRYVRITDFDDNGTLRDDTFKSLPNEIAEPFLLEEGDVLFARSGATVGKTFIFSNYEGKACFAGYLIRARHNEKILAQYLYLYTKSGAYNSWKNSIFIQATIQNIGAEKYSQLEIPLPPLQEQHKIVDYLDKKTSLIDSIIAKKEELIKLGKEERTAIINHAVTKGLDPDAKMKDSGIEWLGEIPEHWEVLLAKYVFIIKNGYAFKSNEYVDEGIPLIRIGDIKSNIKLDTCKKMPLSRLNEFRDFIVRENDILLALTGATIGKNSIYNIKDISLLNQRVAILRPLSNIDIAYLKFIIDSPIFQLQIKIECDGGAQENIGRENLNSFLIVLAPEDEQQQIVSYLDQETKRIDTLIEKTTKQIDLLKEYKEALINEVVTGQRIVD